MVKESRNSETPPRRRPGALPSGLENPLVGVGRTLAAVDAQARASRVSTGISRTVSTKVPIEAVNELDEFYRLRGKQRSEYLRELVIVATLVARDGRNPVEVLRMATRDKGDC